MSPRKSGSDKTRFTLWLPDELMERLTRLQQAQAKESLAEVIRDGLMIYVDLLKARQEGAEFFFEDAEGKAGPIWILPGPPPKRRPRR